MSETVSEYVRTKLEQRRQSKRAEEEKEVTKEFTARTREKAELERWIQLRDVELPGQLAEARVQVEAKRLVAEAAMVDLTGARIALSDLESRHGSAGFAIASSAKKMLATAPAELRKAHRDCVHLHHAGVRTREQLAGLNAAIAELLALSLEVEPDLDEVVRIVARVNALDVNVEGT